MRPKTYADLEVFQPDVHVELVNGDLVFQRSSTPRHQLAMSELNSRLRQNYRGEWLLLTDVDTQCGRDVYRPDVAGWRKPNWPEMESLPVRIRPDFVAEIVSPAYRKYDRHTKRAAYEREGWRHYWIVDPELESLETLKWVEGIYVSTNVFQRDDIVCAEPFPELKFELCDLFLF
jgi:Uma2 family endonuclease